MLGRQPFHNTRRLLNIINSPSSSSSDVFISLDAEKAFDKVEWTYLYFILQKFGFGPEFISWIKFTPAQSAQSTQTDSNLLHFPFTAKLDTAALSPPLICLGY